PGLPYAGLFMDASGNLYGTTAGGGAWGKGTAFELSPPSAAGGGWTESILWDFGNGTDGVGPYAGLIMDNGGNLYGTTKCGGTYGYSVPHCPGTVFELMPPATSGGN